MSEVMLLGVLRQPLPDDPKELLTYDWRQLRSRIREAASELEKAWHAEAEAQKLLEAALEGRDAAIQKADRLEAICKQVEHMFPVHYQSCVAAVDEEADDAL